MSNPESSIQPVPAHGTHDREAEALAILNEISRQRAQSNYFFITINVVITTANFALLAFALSQPGTVLLQYFGIVIAFSFAVIGLPLAVYWVRELREFQETEETMFQALMDSERIYSDTGTLSRYWDRIGDRPKRTSAVFSNKFARVLPILFAALHVVPVYVILFFAMFPDRFFVAPFPSHAARAPVTSKLLSASRALNTRPATRN